MLSGEPQQPHPFHICVMGQGMSASHPKLLKVSPRLSADWLHPCHAPRVSTHLHTVLLAGLAHVYGKVHDQDKAGSPGQHDIAIFLGENSHPGAAGEREPVSVLGKWQHRICVHGRVAELGSQELPAQGLAEGICTFWSLHRPGVLCIVPVKQGLKSPKHWWEVVSGEP